MRETYNAFYTINVVMQAIFTLIFDIGLAVLLAWLAVSKLGLPTWVYVPFIIVGVIVGILSMIRFLITAMHSLENIERSQIAKRRKNERNKKQ